MNKISNMLLDDHTVAHVIGESIALLKKYQADNKRYKMMLDELKRMAMSVKTEMKYCEPHEAITRMSAFINAISVMEI